MFYRDFLSDVGAESRIGGCELNVWLGSSCAINVFIYARSVCVWLAAPLMVDNVMV